MLLPRNLRAKSSKKSQPKKRYRPCRQLFRIFIAKANPAKPSAIRARPFQSASSRNWETRYAPIAPPSTTAIVVSDLLRRWFVPGSGKNFCTMEVRRHSKASRRPNEASTRNVVKLHHSVSSGDENAASGTEIILRKILPIFSAQGGAELANLIQTHQFLP